MIKDEQGYASISKRLNAYRKVLRDFETDEYRKETTDSDIWWKQHNRLVSKINSLEQLLDDCLLKIIVKEIWMSTTKLVAKTPLKLYPSKTVDSLWVVEDKTLGLYVFEESYEDLVSAIKEWLIVLWKEYALESYNRLTEDAWKLKDKLLELFEEKSYEEN